MMDIDPRTLPTWVEEFHVNYGLTGGLLGGLRPAEEPLELDVEWMLAEAEYHANWGA